MARGQGRRFGQNQRGIASDKNGTVTVGDRQSRQYGAVTDLLCHGEIHGLVGGLGGVYYNGTPLADEVDTPKSHALVISGYNSSDDRLVFTDSSAAFAGKTFGSRNVIVRKGVGSFTTNAAMNIGDSFLPCTAFNYSGGNNPLHMMYHNAKIYGLKPLVWIDIVESGSVVETIVRAGREPVNETRTGNTGGIELAGPVTRAVPSGTTFYLDWVGKTSSISSNSQELTLQPWAQSDVTLGTFPSNNQATMVFTSVQQGLHGSQQVKAFSDSFIEFRKGSRYQKGSVGENNAPSVSYMVNPNLGEQHMFSGIRGVTEGAGSAGSTVLKVHPDSTDIVTAQAAQVITDANFNFGQTSLSEIDSFDIDIEFPGGLYALSENGGQYAVFVEFQIIFKYKNTAGADFTEVLMKGVDYGDDSSGGVRFVKELGYDNTTGSLGGSQRFRVDLGKPKDKFAGANFRYGSGTIESTAQRTPFIHTFSIDVAQFQPFVDWEIEVRRLVPSAQNEFWSINKQEQAQAGSRIKLVTAKVHDRLSYPLTAYAVAGFSAQDFPTPPKRAYKLKGRKIQVPTNYLTRDETRSVQASYKRNVSTGAEESSYQTWDGKFRGDLTLNNVHVNHRRVYCNNPAWVFYDILTDKDYGLGEYIQESDIDKYALYQIARYCDELVPNGKGGQEPRFACNVYLQKETEAYKVLKDLSSTFRSMMYWVDGQITLVQDRPKEPVYTFTTGNVEGGMFNYSYTGSKARVNQVRASWNNPEELYKQTLVSVDDLPNIAEQGKIVSKDVVAYGCTSEAQAKRVAQWHLETEIRETELVSFTTSLNAAYLRPGDIINVQDKRVADIEASGRVIAGSTSSRILLDRTVNFPGGVAGNQCNLYLIYPDPGIYLQQETATINSVTYKRGELIQSDASANSLLTGATQEKAANLKDDSGNSVVTTFAPGNRVEVEAISNGTLGTSASIINTTGAFAGGAPAADTIWAISRENTVANDDIKKYRIVGINQTEINKYEISGAQYVAEKFDEIDAERPVVTSKFVDASSRDGVIPAPADITGTLELNSDTKAYDAIISWSTPVESVTDSNGSSATRPYRFLDGYEISTSLGNSPDSSNAFSSLQGRAGSEVHELPGTQRTFKVRNVVPGRYVVRINTINDVGAKSKVVSRVIDFISSGKGITNRVAQLQYAKGLSGTLSHDGAGTITVSASEIQSENSTVAAAAGTFDFTGDNMPNSSTGFLYLDSSGPTLRRVVVHEDGTSNHDFAYLKEVGAANNGLALATGRVTLTEGSTKVVGVAGTSTVFKTDFAVGDLIKFSTTNAPGTQVANSDYRTVVKIESDDVLYVDAVLFDRTGSGGLIAESNIYIHKQLFKPDFEEDSIIAKLTKSSGGAYALEKLPYVPTTANATRNDNKGPWSASTAYSLNDLVTHNGRSYVALQAASGSGQAPTGADTSNSYWSLFASKGDTGPQGAAAYSVSLTASKYAIAYSADGAESDSLVFTAAPQGVTGTATYKFEVDGTEKQAAGSATQYTMADSDEPAAGAAKVVKVTLFDDGTEKATDSVSVYGVQDGTDAVTAILTNEAHVLPTTEGGTVNYTGSGTVVKVFRGSTALTAGSSANQFEVSASASNITVDSTPTASGTTVTFDAASSITADTASITYTITVNDYAGGSDLVLTKVQSFSKAKDGDTGPTGEGTEVIYYVSKSAPNTPTASTVDNLGTGWSTNVPTATENVWVSLGSRAAGATNYTWGAPSLLQEVTSNLLLNEKMLPWEVGTGNATVPGGTWTDNGTTAENTRSLLTDPFGGKSVIWRAINSGTDDNADGGFHSPQVEINPAKTYRFSLFINQKNSTNGTSYFGLNGYNASGTNTAVTYIANSNNTSTNPYFWSGDLPTLDKWYLLIAYLVPHTHTGDTIHPDSGVWDLATGKKVTISQGYYDFKFQSTHTKARIRAYQYYNESSSSDEVHFFAPRIDIADERMPSVQDLLRTSAVPSNTATVYAYKKANSLPGDKPDETRTYTFDTGAFNNSALGNSWSSTLAGSGTGDNMYICQAQVSSVEATVSVTASDWSSASLLTEKGTTGTGATTTATVAFYKASSSNLTSHGMSGSWTYYFATNTIANIGSPNINGWSITPPAISAGETMYVIRALASAPAVGGTPATSDTIAHSDFGTPIASWRAGVNGDPGDPGINTAVVSLYRAHNSATGNGPTSFSGDLVYTFSSGAVTGSGLNSWTTTVPELSAGQYAWVRQAVASATATATTDTIADTEWSEARVHSGVGTNGDPGDPGNTSVVVSLYQVSTSNSNAPNKPADNVGITYTFATGAVSFEGGNNNGWLAEAPTVPKGSYLWVIQELYSANTATQEIDASNWSSPAVSLASGVDGAEGASVNIVFIRSASQPTKPSNDPAPVPSGWSDSPPSGTDLLWASRGLKAAGGTNYEWQDAFQIEGAAHAEVYVYKKSSNETSVTSGATYNFTNNTLALPSGWVKDPPSLTADGEKVYVAVGLVTGASTATTASVTWGTPVVYAQRTDGEDGEDGADGAAGLPAASYLVEYDDLERVLSASALGDGQWWFMSDTSDATSSGANLGNEWHELLAMTQFSIAKTDKAGTNHSSYYSQIEVGDVVTFRFTDTAWVSYRVTQLGATTNYYNFVVHNARISYNESGIANAGLAVATQADVDATPRRATAVGDYIIEDGASSPPTVQIRFSRAPKGDTGLGGIATLKLYRGSNAALDNDDRPSNVGVTFNTDGSTTNWVNVNGDNPWKSNIPGMLSAEGLLDVYEIEATVNREGTVSGIANTAWSTPVLIRNRETWNITSVTNRPIHNHTGMGWSTNDIEATVTATSSHNRKDTCKVESKFTVGTWAAVTNGNWTVQKESETLVGSTAAETQTEGFDVDVEEMVTIGNEKRKYVVVTHESMKNYSTGSTEDTDKVQMEFKCRVIG